MRFRDATNRDSHALMSASQLGKVRLRTAVSDLLAEPLLGIAPRSEGE